MGEAEECWNAAGTRILKYRVEIAHTGLNEHKVVSAPDTDILANKANLQLQKWTSKFEVLEAKRRAAADKAANLEEAQERTSQARKALETIDNLLVHTLSIDDTVNWDSLKKTKTFKAAKPSKPPKPKDKPYPHEPIPGIPRLSFFDKLIKQWGNRVVKACENKNREAQQSWEFDKSQIDKTNASCQEAHEESIAEWVKKVERWEAEKLKFETAQNAFNSKIDSLKSSYFDKSVDAIIENCELVLNNSDYPDSFPKDFELEFNPDTGILIVEYQLPAMEAFPNVKEVKFIASRNELKESYISDSQINKMFDEAIYKIALRTIHELFEADAIDCLEAISFNGWVEAINRATGKEETNCILSIQVKKNEFVDIDLSRIDPKASFRNLKGVAGSKLSALTPIQPILQLTKTDRRFVEGYEVADSLDTSMNLAAMDWEDFEHLIRELFEKEFQSNGGEVKVTQASRDGGVDAIAFDPDPIRGGKIVIQAKRYTNTVGVAAVRDLYGTVLNEGATKGILVSTADYGPDAYQFAKDKPLTLLSGSNLLHLLEKHGHHARIDLREAKVLLAEQGK